MTNGIQLNSKLPYVRDAKTPKTAPDADPQVEDDIFDLGDDSVDDGSANAAGATSSSSKADDKAGRKIVVKRSDLMKLMNGDLDPEDLLPPTGPVADAYADLGKSGYEVSDTQVRHTMDAFDRHREALVVCEDKTNQVYSFKSEAEIATFNQAVSNPSSLSADKRAVLDDLKAIQAAGGEIAFSRGSHLLPTDAAGAMVLVSRGEALVVLDKYGAPVHVKSADEVAAQAKVSLPADPVKDPVVAAIQSLEKKEFAVQPDFELPEDVQVTDFKKMIKHQLHEMTSHDPNKLPINQKKYVIDQLSGTGLATVSPPPKAASAAPALPLPGAQDDDSEPEPEPLELADARVMNRAQILELAQIQSGTMSAQQTQFFADMKKIREDKTREPQIFSRETNGMDTGALHKANDLHAYLNLINGGEIVMLNSDGTVVHLDNPKEVKEYAATGQVTRTRPPAIDPKIDKTNLLMLYYDSPFDPHQKGGIYEDTPMRAGEVGSNANVDMVTLRSDLPQKKNLRNEYLQPDDPQLIKALDPKTQMNDPKTLETFVYDSLKAHPNDKHVRLMVAGHGGAELGLLPDGDENNATAHGAMSVDDFANAVHEGLARFNKESGQSRKIDNLIVGSCLMANTSFIHALAKKGDIEVLSASPETLMGNDPTVMFSYLADPKTADKSAVDFASDMVDLFEGAAAFPGGKKNMQFADTYGAYDLSTSKGKAMADSLDDLFKAVVAEPQYARYVKEDIAHCPTYGVNRILNFQFGINQRDVIQVAERIAGDARIKSDAIKNACKAVVDATSAVVLKQKMGERYADRRGPTLYLPTEKFMLDDRLMSTDLLKSTAFNSFVNLVVEQPENRTLTESLGYEIDKVMSAMRKAARDAKKPPTPGSPTPSGTPSPAGPPAGTAPANGAAATGTAPANGATTTAAAPASGTASTAAAPANGATTAAAASASATGTTAASPASASAASGKSKKMTLVLGAQDSEADKTAESLKGLEKIDRPWYKQVFRYAVAMPVVAAATAVGAIAGAAVGITILTPLGTVLGLHAGLTGRSVAQNFMADKEDPAPATGGSTPSGSTPSGSAPTAPAGSTSGTASSSSTGSAATTGASSSATPASGSASGAGSSAATPSSGGPSGSGAPPPQGVPPGLEDTLKKATRPLIRLGVQAAFFPMETGGELINRSVSYKHGNALGRLTGTVGGTATGTVGGALTGVLLGGAAGGFIAHAIASRIMGTRGR